MSIKTLRKRIALVAVSALGVGLLSVAPASAVSAGLVEIAGMTGQCAANNGSTGALITAASSYTSGNGGTTPVTVTVAQGSQFTLQGANSEYMQISGAGSVQILTLPANHSSAVNAAGKVTITNHSTAAAVTFIAPNTGTTTVTAGSAATTAATDTNTLTIVVVAACGTTTWSATRSSVSTSTTGDSSFPTNENVDEATVAESGKSLFIRIKAKNAFGSDITSGTYYATATNGALLNWGGTIGTDPLKGTASIATTSDDASVELRVDPASAAAGGTTTVTISLGATTIATKTLTFLGEATKITIKAVSSGNIGTTGTSQTGFFVYTLTDAAGRQVNGSVSLLSTSATVRTPAAADNGKAVTPLAAAAPTNLNADIITAIGSTNDGIGGFDCTSAGGSGESNLTVRHTSAVTSTVLTADVKAVCAGGVNTYAVSTDKATYKVGEIAIITITAKDSAGNAVSDATTVGASASVSPGGGTLTKAVASSDSFSGGVKVYRAQMTTAGSFNVVVNLSGATDTSKSAAYTVTSSDVSNAEVLASIVKLIAAINKQIRALQKSLRR